jgi:hypothetical protein
LCHQTTDIDAFVFDVKSFDSGGDCRHIFNQSHDLVNWNVLILLEAILWQINGGLAGNSYENSKC